MLWPPKEHTHVLLPRLREGLQKTTKKFLFFQTFSTTNFLRFSLKENHKEKERKNIWFLDIKLIGQLK